eukprot:GILI01014139.1.p1 GENE.GILI01014139.1~~GILI01014139.1.p1  ORF type:complete len:326 (-),score=27.33 GILI01014139.1:145-1122(-)
MKNCLLLGLVLLLLGLGLEQAYAGAPATTLSPDRCVTKTGAACRPRQRHQQLMHMHGRPREPIHPGHEEAKDASHRRGAVRPQSIKFVDENCVEGDCRRPSASVELAQLARKGERCKTSRDCIHETRPFINSVTGKQEGEWSLGCHRQSRTCRFFPPLCNDVRHAQCNNCKRTAGTLCKALGALPKIIDVGICGRLNLFRAVPGSDRAPFGPILSSAATHEVLVALHINNPLNVAGHMGALCSAELLAAGIHMCGGDPSCQAAVSVAVTLVCTAVGKSVGDLCNLAQRYVFEQEQVKQFLVEDVCMNVVCRDCVTDGCYMDLLDE